MGRKNMITLALKILPKTEVLNVEGRAIVETLKRKGHAIEDCRYGKLLILKIKAKTKESAVKKAKEMAEAVLCNSLIETYEVEVLTKSP